MKNRKLFRKKVNIYSQSIKLVLTALIVTLFFTAIPLSAKNNDNSYFEIICRSKLDSALLFSIDSLGESIKNDNKLAIADWYFKIGSISRRMGIYNLSNSFLKMSGQVYSELGLQDSLLKVNLNLGFLNQSAGNYKKAINFYYSSIKQIQSANIGVNLYRVYGGLRNFYQLIGDYSSVEFYLNKSDSTFRADHDFDNLNNTRLLEAKLDLEKFKFDKAKLTLDTIGLYIQNSGNNGFKGMFYQSLGEYYMHLGDKEDSALKYFNLSIQTARLYSDSLLIGDDFSFIAYFYLQKKNYPMANFYDREALKVRINARTIIPMLSSITNLARNYNLMGDYNHSIAILDSALAIRQMLEMKKFNGDAYKLYYENYKKMGNFDQALFYLEKYYSLNQSLNKNSDIIDAVKMNQKFEDQRELTLHMGKSLQFQKKIIGLISAFVVIILVILIVIFNLYRDKKKRNYELDFQKERLTETLAQLEESREELSVLNTNLESLVEKRTDELTEEIEQRKKVELELKNSTDKIQKALDREMELNHLKSSIINSISHEFRTPLTVINMSVELLNYFDKSTDELNYNKQIHKIKDAISLLIKLCDGIAGFEEVNLKKQDQPFVEFDLNEIIKDVINDCKRFERQNRIVNLETVASEIVIFSDVEMLYKVIKNVLINAFDFSKTDTAVNIKIIVVSNKAVIEIQDFGTGISQFEINKIFEPFYRGSNAIGRSGLGLGLSFVKDYCQMLGVKYEIESVLNEGTSFKLYVPALGMLNTEPIGEFSV